jgi:hypothetical protein
MYFDRYCVSLAFIIRISHNARSSECQISYKAQFCYYYYYYYHYYYSVTTDAL